MAPACLFSPADTCWRESEARRTLAPAGFGRSGASSSLQPHCEHALTSTNGTGSEEVSVTEAVSTSGFEHRKIERASRDRKIVALRRIVNRAVKSEVPVFS